MDLSNFLALQKALLKMTEDFSALISSSVLASAGREVVMDPLLKVCWSIAQSERGESLEWQRNWTGAPYDEAGCKREDFVLETPLESSFLARRSVVLTKSKGVSNGFGNGTSFSFERRYALWRASIARIEPAAVK